EPADGPAVLLGHPVGRLDLAARGHVPVEVLDAPGFAHDLLVSRWSPFRKRAAEWAARASGPSAPSGRYQWAMAFMAERMKTAASPGSGVASSPAATPSATTPP